MSSGRKFYLTTAIDYPNSLPHIGTAFEKIGADVQARYRRMQGCDVHFLMGNDEHTIKVSQRATELGKGPKTYVDEMAEKFTIAGTPQHAIRKLKRLIAQGFDEFIFVIEESGGNQRTSMRALGEQVVAELK